MTVSNKKVCLLDLPVLPKDRDWAGGTEVIIDTFIEERNSIKNVDDLLAFVEKWNNIWLLNDEITQEEYDIVDGAFDPYLIFDCVMKILRKEEIKDVDSNVRIAMNICIPHSAMRAMLLAKKYGVGTDLGFVRLYLDPYPEHMDAMRA